MTQTSLWSPGQSESINECYISFYRKEGDNEFMNIIANEINTEVRLESHCFVPVRIKYLLSFVLCSLRKQWFSWLLERRGDPVCLFWLDPVNQWLSWDHSKRHRQASTLSFQNRNVYQFFITRCALQGTGASSREGGRKKRTFPRQSQQPGTKSGGRGFAAAAF